VRSGKPVAEVAEGLGVSDQTIYRWRHQDEIDRGKKPGLRSKELEELQAAKKRITELESELAIANKAIEMFKDVVPPKGSSRRSN